MALKPSIVSPQVVRWARMRLGLSEGALADSLGIKKNSLIGMETGVLPVSMTQAKNLARMVLKPVEMLMGSKPPVFKTGVADFRTVGNDEISNVSIQLEATLLHAQECQVWYSEMREDNGYAQIPFIGCISCNTPVVEAAGVVSRLLGISDSGRQSCKDSKEYFKLIVRSIENNNILVMQSGNVGNNNKQKLDVEEFRGFALSDKYAPLIFVNTSDSANARTFTLIHELVHLLLGNTGISAPESNPDPQNQIEQYCNAVASEYLLPAKTLTAYCEACGKLDYEKISAFALKQKISFAVVAISARKHRLISQSTFDRLYAEYRQKCAVAADSKRAQEKKRKGGPPFEVVAARRLGSLLIKAILTEVRYGGLRPSEACHLLSVQKIATAEKLGAYVWGRGD